MMQQRYKKQIQKVVKRNLPKTNGRLGALPPIDGTGEDDAEEHSSKRARSLQDKHTNALSPGPELREINLTKVETRDLSPTDVEGHPHNESSGDNSTVVVHQEKENTLK